MSLPVRRPRSGRNLRAPRARRKRRLPRTRMSRPPSPGRRRCASPPGPADPHLLGGLGPGRALDRPRALQSRTVWLHRLGAPCPCRRARPAGAGRPATAARTSAPGTSASAVTARMTARPARQARAPRSRMAPAPREPQPAAQWRPWRGEERHRDGLLREGRGLCHRSGQLGRCRDHRQFRRGFHDMPVRRRGHRRPDFGDQPWR